VVVTLVRTGTRQLTDGTEGQVDLGNEFDGLIFEPLRDPDFFQQFTLEGHTLTWPNGADFAPKYLHAEGIDRLCVA
jgi:hypothetical protein